MKTIDLDGNISDWKISGKVFKHSQSVSKSSLHLKARKILSELYPTLQVLEEVPLNPKRGITLYLDFYLKLINLAVEVHGEQHYKFVPHFHQSTTGFMKYKQNENNKEAWCEKNGIRLVSLPYNEDENEWRSRIIGQHSES